MTTNNKLGNFKKVIDKLLEDPYKYANDIPINNLIDILKQLSDYYYNSEESLVTDEIYDLLRDILEQRDPSNPFLKEVGSPVNKDQVDLPYPMSSLDKIKPDTNALDNWKKKYPTGPYVASEKLDGVSGQQYVDIKKKNNKFKLFTRGDATTGQDITHLIPYLFKDKNKLDKLPNGTSIRGEIIMSKKNFATIKDKYKNARNTVAGLVNSKHFSVDLAKLTDFVTYEIIHPKLSPVDQMNKIKEWGLPIAHYKVINDPKELTNEMLSEYLQDRRKNSDYDTDGVVVKDSSQAYENTATNPSHSFAFKMVLTDQVAEVKVLDIFWNISKYGYLKPVIKIQPIQLVGVTITNATAHNAKYIVDNNLGPGSVIKIVRSGDVIPYIMEVLKPSATGKPKMPDIPYSWNDSGVDIIVKDIHGAAKDTIIIKQITHFFQVLKVKYISEGIVTKLVNHGYKTIQDILNTSIKKLSEIDGIGDKVLTKIFENVRVAFETTNLATLMAASNTFGRGFGVRKITPIIEAYPNIMHEKWNADALKQKVLLLDGFDEKTAKQFANNFDKFKKFFVILEQIKLISVDHLKKPVQKVAVQLGVLFKDMKFVFTGVRNKELEDFIIANGGQITTTVSKNTDMLLHVKGIETSGSYKKAKELNIETMTVEDFKQKYIK